MSIDPKASQRLNREIAEEISDRLIAALKDAYDNGALGLKRAKPREFLNAILSGTIGGDVYLETGFLTGDLALILPESYLEGRKNGTSPLTMAERLTEERDMIIQENLVAQQMQEAQPEMIVQPQPVPPEVPDMWPKLFSLPLEVVGWVLSDLRRMMRDRERKADEREPEAVGVAY